MGKKGDGSSVHLVPIISYRVRLVELGGYSTENVPGGRTFTSLILCNSPSGVAKSYPLSD